jgi:hypothetical protein
MPESRLFFGPQQDARAQPVGLQRALHEAHAVHRTYQIGKRGEQGRGQGAAESGGFLGEVEREIGEDSAVTRALGYEQRLYQGREFTAIFRFDVRFHGSRVIAYKNLNIMEIAERQSRRRPLECPQRSPANS